MEEGQRYYTLKNFHIMVVDDFAYMGDLYKSMLQEFAVGKITKCDDSGSVISRLKSWSRSLSDSNLSMPDIIITDWLMPDGSGSELLKFIRTSENDLIRFMPVIVVSAYTGPIMVSKARDAGANEVMVKPISGETLASRVLSVIDKPRPFIKGGGFFGPDRRRKEVKFLGKDKRVTKADHVKVNHEG